MAVIKYRKADGTYETIPLASGGGDVESVNGKTGEVVLTAEDIALESEDKTVEEKVIENSTAIAELEETDSDLQEQITNLKSRGRYLSNWNATTGLPVTDPSTELPYEYRQGDYYIIGTVGETNYKPTGSEYTGDASETVETIALAVGDEYIYDGTQWVFQKNAPIDLSGYAKTDVANTFTAEQTFTSNIVVDERILSPVNKDLYLGRKNKAIYSEHIRPAGIGTIDLGSTYYRWKDFYLAGNISDATNSVTVAQIAGGLLGMDAPTSTTLTDEQVARIKNGCIIHGTFLGLTEATYFAANIHYGNIKGLVYAADGSANKSSFRYFQINSSTKVINVGDPIITIALNDGKVDLPTLKTINNKSIPAYPTNTGTFVLKYVNGSLTWLDETPVSISTATYNGSIASSKDYRFTVPATEIIVASCETQTGDLQPMWSLTFEAGNGCSLTLPNNTKWVGGTAPTLTSGKIYTVVIKPLGTHLLAVAGEF